MPNAFDQFDQQAPAANAFDQFEAPAYRGSVLPFNVDQQGKSHFDLTAGIPGMFLDAMRLPADVVSGKQPVIGQNGQADPQLLNRSINFATSMTPVEFGSKVPSALDLKNAATAGYDAFRNSGLEFHGPAVSDLINGIKQNLESDGIIAEHAPKTFAALNKATSDVAGIVGQPGASAIATPANMQAIRRSIGNAASAGGDDAKAARTAKQAIDGFLSGPPASAVLAEPPEGAAAVAQGFANANANFAAAQRSNDLTGTLDRANTGILDQAEARAHASNSGRNIDNSVRQRVASFLQDPNNLAGFTQPEIDALNHVVNGGFLQNRLRAVGNYFGGGGGLGQLAAGTAGAFIAGSHFGPEGAALGAMVPTAVGLTAKSLENSIGRRALNPIDEMTRMRSPLYDATQSVLPPMNRDQAIMRALLPGLLAPQQPLPTIPRGLLDQMA